MTIKLVVWLLVATFLLTGGTVQAGSPGMTGEGWQIGGPAMLTGQGYHLMSQLYSVCGASSGAGYQLQTLAALASTETGCCCLYLPSVLY